MESNTCTLFIKRITKKYTLDWLELKVTMVLWWYMNKYSASKYFIGISNSVQIEGYAFRSVWTGVLYFKIHDDIQLIRYVVVRTSPQNYFDTFVACMSDLVISIKCWFFLSVTSFCCGVSTHEL